MRITYDPRKRNRTIQERGLDFEDAVHVFEGRTYDIPDLRRDYGELRIRTIGYLRNRMVMIGWTQRGDARHVFSMRKINDREQAKYAKQIEKDWQQSEEG